MLSEYRFPADLIDWKPIAVRKDQTKALAGAFVDVRNIQAALDDLAPGWQSRIDLLPADRGFAAVCTITIDGLERSDTGAGETPMDASNQAFRRTACAHGLGRYLWLEAPRIWAPYDAQAKAFSKAGMAQLRAAVGDNEEPDPLRWLHAELANTFTPDERTPAKAFIIQRYCERETPGEGVRTSAGDLANDELLKIVYSLRDNREAWRRSYRNYAAN